MKENSGVLSHVEVDGDTVVFLCRGLLSQSITRLQRYNPLLFQEVIQSVANQVGLCMSQQKQ